MRPSGRKVDQLREIVLEPGLSRYAEGSCLVRFGNTVVGCTATVEDRAPPFLKDTGKGWVTAEYGMLPRATHTRGMREAAKGKQSGRTQEIQRLIGRALRSVVNLENLGERQIIIDCDVVQADGGTRTAAITGGFVALYQALEGMVRKKQIRSLPVTDFVAAVSCGIYKGNAVLDLDYDEDGACQADCNFVLTGGGGIVEIQGTAEEKPFSEPEYTRMMALARQGVETLIARQKAFLGVEGNDAAVERKAASGNA